MVHNIENLPYFNIESNFKEKSVANFLLRKFKPGIKKKIPQHYLVQPIPFETLEFIKKICKKYPYFLRLDIKLYYPSVLPQILLEKLPDIYQKILEKPPSRKFKNYLKNEIREFLAKSPYGKGLPISSRLPYVLAGILLLNLDLQIKAPFLRQNDDYLIFCKSKGEAEKLLKNVILPKLFEKLDMFIRQRLRRYLTRNKDQRNKTANLLLTNQQLKNIGLKSLVDIKEKYARKKKRISSKRSKILNKTGNHRDKLNWPELEEKSHKYEQKLILAQLSKLTSLVEKLLRKLNN